MSWLALVLIAAIGPAEAWPMPRWERAEPAELGLDRARLEQARDYALTGDGSGHITRGGKLVLAWGDPDRRHDLKSSTKSIGVTALGLALRDGKLQLEDRALRHYPGPGESAGLPTRWMSAEGEDAPDQVVRALDAGFDILV